jgi:fatty-acyl-CoA synthase
VAIEHFDWIAHHATARPNVVAQIDLHTGRQFTYGEMHDRVGRLASGLRTAYGVTKGDRVAVLAHNSSDLFDVQFACARLGAVFAPMNWRLTVPELTYIASDCTPVVLIHDPDFQDTALKLAEASGIRHLCSRDPDNSQFDRLIETGDPAIAPEPVTHDDIAALLYTSGTTGHPKGAIITHGMRFWQIINLTGPERLTAESVCLVTLPQFHVGGLDVYANPCFHFGGKVVTMRGYDPAEALRLISSPEAGITHFVGAPAHYLFMEALPAFETATFSPNLLACIAASPVPLPQLQKWERRGLPLLQGYGMTETCGVVTMMDPEDRTRKAGSAGKLCLHVAARVVRADGTDAAVGEMGELWVKGPSVTPGYWKNEAGTKAAFTGEWLHTGDAALIDADSHYYIVDRWKDMYISGGENVYPAEVEEVLFKLDGIAEVAIIGVPDERWGEVGRAIVALKPGHTLTEADIMQHCDGQLARYKQPRSVRFVETLPRNATGKVHKPTLRKMFGDV